MEGCVECDFFWIWLMVFEFEFRSTMVFFEFVLIYCLCFGYAAVCVCVSVWFFYFLERWMKGGYYGMGYDFRIFERRKEEKDHGLWFLYSMVNEPSFYNFHIH